MDARTARRGILCASSCDVFRVMRSRIKYHRALLLTLILFPREAACPKRTLHLGNREKAGRQSHNFPLQPARKVSSTRLIKIPRSAKHASTPSRLYLIRPFPRCARPEIFRKRLNVAEQLRYTSQINSRFKSDVMQVARSRRSNNSPGRLRHIPGA